ncbi:MAG: DUF4931 domain-containing protein [Deltaproteobacteria bacterium]|nr:DUF4931 domain-containing protein [Deltaproteobacteria bacterium]
MDDEKPQLRYNLITGDWVIIAPKRGKRDNLEMQIPTVTMGSKYEESCPFCLGNDAATPTETIRISNNKSWSVRAVKNLFPALAAEGDLHRNGCSYERSMPGIGQHEVIIESPYHNDMVASLPVEHVRDILGVYLDRMRAFYADPRISHVIAFKNHGQTAGSTIDHPHSQIVGTPVIPGQVRVRIEEALRQYGQLGECMYCHCVRQELASGTRIIEATSDFVVLIPYAALSPYHIWIIPHRHSAYFGDISVAETTSLASILRRTLRRLNIALGNPHYNYVIRSLSPLEANVKYGHWYISIVVRLTRLAGFELGTGMFINPALPEESAARLRNVQID